MRNAKSRDVSAWTASVEIMDIVNIEISLIPFCYFHSIWGVVLKAELVLYFITTGSESQLKPAA